MMSYHPLLSSFSLSTIHTVARIRERFTVTDAYQVYIHVGRSHAQLRYQLYASGRGVSYAESSVLMPSLRASLHSVLAADEAQLSAALRLDGANATVEPRRSASRALANVVRSLLTGAPAHIHVVGSSAAAGAGGVGVDGSFGALLASALNASIAAAERASGQRAGRVFLHNMAQGGTHSLWAAFMAEELHGLEPPVIIWEYSINDFVLGQESMEGMPLRRHRRITKDAMRRRHAITNHTCRFVSDFWLRRVLPLGAHVMLAYLWDKLPRQALMAQQGLMWKCYVRPYPCSAFTLQRDGLERHAAAGADIAAVSVAAYMNARATGNRSICPLVADHYFHPSAAGHQLTADLLRLLLLRALLPALRRTGREEGPRARRTVAAPDDTVVPSASRQPAPVPLPCLPACTSSGCNLTRAVARLLDGGGTRISAQLAWTPRARTGRTHELGDGDLALSGQAPPLGMYAKSDTKRMDRKWMWTLPPCGNNGSLELRLPAREREPVVAFSFYGMASVDTAIIHELDGRPIVFERALGSPLQYSWGYLARWHLLPEDDEAPRRPRVWRMCARRTSDDARCKGRCGNELILPARTAAVAWAVSLTREVKLPRIR